MSSDNALVIREEAGLPTLSAPELRHRVKVIQQVMRDVMKPGIHFGEIPGTGKPSLWQPGAELLNLTFGISIRCDIVEERIADEEIFYRVRATATSHEGRELGTREAVCSTREKKYRWRRPVHLKEYEAMPEHLRRITWDKEGKEILQVRTDPGDLIETVLQMATKRAHVALTRQVTGCSDMFGQELEEDEPEAKAPVQQPQPMTPVGQASAPAAAAAEGQLFGAGGLAPVNVLSTKKAKSGTKDDGSAWTLFVVKTSGGEFITFDTRVAAAAEKARADDKQVQIVAAEAEPGKSPRIEEIRVIG